MERRPIHRCLITQGIRSLSICFRLQPPPTLLPCGCAVCNWRGRYGMRRLVINSIGNKCQLLLGRVYFTGKVGPRQQVQLGPSESRQLTQAGLPDSGNLSLSIKVKSVTSITAGPGVGGQAVRGARGEADVDAPEGWAEALSRALAHLLQIRAALVHF